MKTELSSLLDRLGELTGPDREVDAWIDLVHQFPDATAEAVANDLEYITGRRDGIKGETVDNAVERTSRPPHYTESLDSALTLVPDGCFVWSIWQDCDVQFWQAMVSRRAPTNAGRATQPGKSATAAIALCIAALKAREALRAREAP